MVVDWLNFTFKYSDEDIKEKEPLDLFFEVFPEFLEIVETSVIKKLRTHYQHCLLFNEDILVLYDDSTANNQKGVNVQVPSHSLNYFYSLMCCKSVLDIFDLLNKRNCQVSRIDLCFDDYTKELRPKDFNLWMCNNKFKSLIRTWSFCGGHVNSGHTFYFGNRKNKMLRIYDKDIESDGLIDAVRYEFEFHNDRARAIVQSYVENGYIDFVELLLSFVDVVNREECGTVTKCSRVKEFDNFIQNLTLSNSLYRGSFII